MSRHFRVSHRLVLINRALQICNLFLKQLQAVRKFNFERLIKPSVPLLSQPSHPQLSPLERFLLIWAIWILIRIEKKHTQLLVSSDRSDRYSYWMNVLDPVSLLFAYFIDRISHSRSRCARLMNFNGPNALLWPSHRLLLYIFGPNTCALSALSLARAPNQSDLNFYECTPFFIGAHNVPE